VADLTSEPAMEKEGGDVQVWCSAVGQSPSGAAIEEEPGGENGRQGRGGGWGLVKTLRRQFI
jgi:hypothetical protein